jgi:hypothetical protein
MASYSPGFKRPCSLVLGNKRPSSGKKKVADFGKGICHESLEINHNLLFKAGEALEYNIKPLMDYIEFFL